jgi:16S rRNA (adenine1518-N6/adenine1519-N6)-dimethyltransferase
MPAEVRGDTPKVSLQELCQRYNIRFKKQLGQNLLLDDNINRIMVDAADLTDEIDVVEVGAGLGALTVHMFPRARRVFAVEIDRTFMECLEDRFGHLGNVVLFRGDILNHPLENLVAEHLPGAKRLRVVANLPYYITTPLLFHFWEAPLHFERIVVMVQEEVGLRLVSQPGDKDYGALALAAQLRGDVDIVHKVPRTCFRPTPKVDSCIIRIRTFESPRYPGVDMRLIMRIIRTAFSQRRKTLRNTLVKNTATGIPGPIMEAALEQTGIDPGRRPQTLSLDEFAAIAEVAGRLRSAEPTA